MHKGLIERILGEFQQNVSDCFSLPCHLARAMRRETTRAKKMPGFCPSSGQTNCPSCLSSDPGSVCHLKGNGFGPRDTQSKVSLDTIYKS